ncbi:hypothetical protein UFOVP1635_1, partial [uncultured Caudovirales phage]
VNIVDGVNLTILHIARQIQSKIYRTQIILAIPQCPGNLHMAGAERSTKKEYVWNLEILRDFRRP